MTNNDRYRLVQFILKTDPDDQGLTTTAIQELGYATDDFEEAKELLLRAVISFPRSALNPLATLGILDKETNALLVADYQVPESHPDFEIPDDQKTGDLPAPYIHPETGQPVPEINDDNAAEFLEQAEKHYPIVRKTTTPKPTEDSDNTDPFGYLK